MRVFESLDDVKEYLQAEADKYQAEATAADGRKATERRGTKGWWIYEAQWGSAVNRAGAYRDARAALDEIRPGFFDALEAARARGKSQAAF